MHSSPGHLILTTARLREDWKMYNAELLSDRIAAASLERRRNREMQRQDRIFNAKVRTIGVSFCLLQQLAFSFCMVI